MSNQEIISEQLSFYKLFTEKGYRVVIPIIQRDYAQGRKSAMEVRTDFLSALYDYLKTGDPFRDLDFIYGDVDDSGNFIPLDGQQRLTTLFLLHWYIASNEEGAYDDFKNRLSFEGFSKFVYKTRQSSTDFCNALIKNGINLRRLIPPDKDKLNSLSKTIKDSSWFYLSWNNDPTVQSMLSMLDAIHEERFKQERDFYTKLTNSEKPVITFQFLPLNKQGLSDDLYIKMNSRGKPLTKFETFKAKFEQQIGKSDYNSNEFELFFGKTKRKVDAKTYFSYKIDTQWTYLFWTFKDLKTGIFDDQIMNLIHAISVNNSALLEKEVRQYIDDKAKLPISYYINQKGNFIDTLIRFFDIISNSKEFATSLNDFYYYNELEEFKNIIYYKFSDAAYLERIQFFAYYSFLVKWQGKTDGFRDWMRVIVNLSENTRPYDDDTAFINSILLTNDLLKYSDNILDYLRTNERKNMTGFNVSQLKEERIKAHLIKIGTNWAESIYEYEQNKYFKGQLTFALAFSGIEAFFDKSQNCEWTNDEDKVFRKLFDDYIKKTFALFDENGLNQESRKEHCLHRAVLSKGDYLLSFRSNYSFLTDTKHRDISWKRLLLGDDDRSKKRDYFKQVLDDLKSDSDLFIQLDSLAVDFPDDIPSWRKKFISQPKLFEYFGPLKCARFAGDDIFLLKKVKTSGEHYELYTLALYLEIEDSLDYSPFQKMEYKFVSGESETPYLYFDNWCSGVNAFGIDVSYTGGFFIFEFFDRIGKDIPQGIIEVLSNFEFIQKENIFEIGKTEIEVMGFLKDLFSSLTELG